MHVAPGRYNINRNTQKFLKVFMQSAKVKKAGVRGGINKEINIAFLSIFTTGNRTNDTQVGKPGVSLHDFKDFLPVYVKKF
jgi:hypothetical protein